MTPALFEVHPLAATLVLSLLVQAIFFVFAATLKTDKVTDLSYGLTFIAIAAYLAARRREADVASVVVLGMVVLWGIRLAVYLLYRIIQMKRDARFDGVREHFWKFFRFWFFQGLAVWIVMLPVTIWFDRHGGASWFMPVGALVWAVGLVIETVADVQKFRHKSRPSGGTRWVDSGLWRYSRHPNYFGELLCWWGVFLAVVADLGAWVWVGALGPIAITYLLLRVTGIPTLEKSAAEKWSASPEYQAYRARTRLLLPWPK